jgi:hypothetical protein
VFYFPKPKGYNNCPSGILTTHKSNLIFQKITCYYCLRPIVYYTTKENNRDRYFESMKIECPYPDCSKAFNRIICPQCNGKNISVSSGQCNCNECGNCFPLIVQEKFEFKILPDFMEKKELRTYYDDIESALELANGQQTIDTIEGLRVFQRLMHIYCEIISVGELALSFVNPVVGLGCYLLVRICSGVHTQAEIVQARNSGKIAIQNLKQARRQTKDKSRQKSIDKSIKKIEKAIKKLDERF